LGGTIGNALAKNAPEHGDLPDGIISGGKAISWMQKHIEKFSNADYDKNARARHQTLYLNARRKPIVPIPNLAAVVVKF
jgi:hypothetical protein